MQLNLTSNMIKKPIIQEDDGMSDGSFKYSDDASSFKNSTITPVNR